jgi:predicted  nucleic acid-binding Zn-ribbon protein
MNEILNLNNEISRLKKELEEQEKETAGLRSRMDYALQNESAKTLEHGQVWKKKKQNLTYS